MPLHFSREEHEQRILRARRALANDGLAALILFAPESLVSTSARPLVASPQHLQQCIAGW
jgi:hypothetical protein